MTEFNVHLFPVIRILVENIESDTMEEAIEKALQSLPPGFIDDHIRQPSEGYMGDAEECPSAMVDVVGDEYYNQSKSFIYRDGWALDQPKGELPFGIIIDDTGDGGHCIQSEMKEVCPYCSCIDCYGDCDGSLGDIDNLEDEEATEGRKLFNAMVDGVEATIINHLSAGIDIYSPAYIEGIKSAMEGIGNNCD
mgnify:CR=1 FL=1